MATRRPARQIPSDARRYWGPGRFIGHHIAAAAMVAVECPASFSGRKTSFISTTTRCVASSSSYIVGMTELILWHDGGCPLCRREIALMRRLDRRGAIDFVDVSRAPAAACPVDPAELLARFHATEDGRLLSGAAAFAAMWRAIPLLRPIGLAARSPRVLAMLERLYLVFLRFRPRLQRLLADRNRA